MKTTRILGLAACLFGIAASPAAHAIVSYSEAMRTELVPGDMGGAFDGVGKLSIYYNNPMTGNTSFAGNCSGSLLDGGRYVLTAGHCATGSGGTTQVSFQQGAVTRNVVNTYVNPNYAFPTWTNLLNGADLAILELDSPVTGIQGFHLSTSSVLGQTALLAGYGRIGNGSTGATDQPDVEGALAYFGYNEYDVLIPGAYGNSYAFDFDDGTAGNDMGCIVYGACGTGLGTQEVATAFGDSGGGGFVWDGTQWLLSAVHSVGYAVPLVPCPLDPSKLCGDMGNAHSSDSTFGKFGGDVAVFSQVSWINALIGGTSSTVPEPGTWALGLMGLGALAFSRRRATTPR
jgi:MYXO-CTERM domain-containing protein